MTDLDDKLEAVKRAMRAYAGAAGALPAVRARLLEELGKAAEEWNVLDRTKRSGVHRFDLPPK